MGPDAMILVFWILSFNLTFSFCSFTFTKRLCSSSSLSVIRVVSSTFIKLRPLSASALLLIFFPSLSLIQKVNRTANQVPIYNICQFPCGQLQVTNVMKNQADLQRGVRMYIFMPEFRYSATVDADNRKRIVKCSKIIRKSWVLSIIFILTFLLFNWIVVYLPCVNVFHAAKWFNYIYSFSFWFIPGYWI